MTILSIGLGILGIIVFIGLIRIIIKPWNGWSGMFLDLLLIDILCDILVVIIESLGE